MKNLVIAFLVFICLALSIKNISCVYHSKELFIEKNSLPENQVPKIIHSQEMMDEFIFGFIHKIGKLSYRAQNQIMRLKSPLSKKIFGG